MKECWKKHPELMPDHIKKKEQEKKNKETAAKAAERDRLAELARQRELQQRIDVFTAL